MKLTKHIYLGQCPVLKYSTGHSIIDKTNFGSNLLNEIKICPFDYLIFLFSYSFEILTKNDIFEKYHHHRIMT